MAAEKQFKNTWLGKLRKKLDLSAEEMAQGLEVSERGFRKAESEPNPTTWSGHLLKAYIDEHGLGTLRKVFKKRGIEVPEDR